MVVHCTGENQQDKKFEKLPSDFPGGKTTASTGSTRPSPNGPRPVPMT